MQKCLYKVEKEISIRSRKDVTKNVEQMERFYIGEVHIGKISLKSYLATHSKVHM